VLFRRDKPTNKAAALAGFALAHARANEHEAFHIIGPILVADVDASESPRVLKDVHSGIATHERAATFWRE
jgi:hypothetical protein